MPERSTSGYRFGVFELDTESRELRRQGRRIKLQEKPFQTLELLLEHAGEVVTREQLRERLWSTDTFVQVDDNLNTAVRRVREALGDPAESPRFVETVPRRGYRFLGPVEPLKATVPVEAALPERARARMPRWAVALATLIFAAAAGYAGFHFAASRHSPVGRTMLAVMPFRNLTGEAAQDYISDGITEELIAHLGRMNPARLGVIARSSIMRFRSSSQDARKTGAELGVSFLLEGSFRRSGENIGITAQLVDVHDGAERWAETWEMSASDLFRVERNVARGAAEALAIRLVPELEVSLARASTTNTAAYEAYLTGLHEWNRGTKESFHAAAGAFEQAASLDPDFALAHDGAARSWLSLADYHFVPVDDAVRKARQQVDIALRLDRSIPQSHELAAELLDMGDPRATGVDDLYRKAIALNPSDAHAQRVYALYLLAHQRGMESQNRIREAVRLDPMSPSMLSYAAYVFYRTKSLQEAQENTNRALAIDPNYPFALYVQGHLYADAGRLNDSISVLEKSVATSGRTPKYLFYLANTYLKAGQPAQAKRLLHELEQQAATGFVPPEFIRDLADELRSKPGTA